MRRMHAVAPLLLAVGLLAAGRASEAGAVDRDDAGASLAFLVELGTTLPEQTLSSGAEPVSGAEQRFEIVSGSARFVGGESALVRVPRDGRVVLPEIVPAGDESVVRVTAGSWQTELRVIGLSPAKLAELETVAAIDPSVVLDSQKSFARVDFGKLIALAPLHAEYTAFPSRGGAPPRAGCSAPLYFYGPGRVFWQMSNPASYGYSVKLENANNYLVWGSGSMQEIDGLYNRNWGCFTAFKVPNNCDLHVGTGGFGCCCVGWALPQCSWINPGPLTDWPDCPL